MADELGKQVDLDARRRPVIPPRCLAASRHGSVVGDIGHGPQHRRVEIVRKNIFELQMGKRYIDQARLAHRTDEVIDEVSGHARPGDRR